MVAHPTSSSNKYSGDKYIRTRVHVHTVGGVGHRSCLARRPARRGVPFLLDRHRLQRSFSHLQQRLAFPRRAQNNAIAGRLLRLSGSSSMPRPASHRPMADGAGRGPCTPLGACLNYLLSSFFPVVPSAADSPTRAVQCAQPPAGIGLAASTTQTTRERAPLASRTLPPHVMWASDRSVLCV
jgi:hypothetical protein